jgi:hypothetical protein
MATTPLDLPILISQLPNMQQIAGSHIIPQDAQQALFGQMVAENQRRVDHTVQQVEKKEGMEPISEEAGGKNSSPRFARQRRKPPPETQPEPDTQSSNASPWAGNIINVKI